jgi:hypothetical protein
LTPRRGANWACDAPKADDDANLVGAATIDADAIAVVAAMILRLFAKTGLIEGSIGGIRNVSEY